METFQQAAEHISSAINCTPRFAVILGSGLGSFADMLTDSIELPYHDIPHFPISTVEGHEGKMVIGLYQDIPILVMQGRLHYYEGYTMAQVAFPIRCLLQLGIKNLIVTNASGSVDQAFQPGDLMLIKDHIKLVGDSPLRGANIDDFGPRFNDMSDPYTKEIRELAIQSAQELNIELKEGVYYYMSGPSYETASEVRAIHILGGNAVGMSTVPEVIAAAHGGMKILGISCISNLGTGISSTRLSHQEVVEAGLKVRQKFTRLLEDILIRWNNSN